MNWEGTSAAGRLRKLALCSKEDEKVRKDAIYFLSLKTVNSLDCFRVTLLDKEPTIRRVTAECLGRVQPTKTDQQKL
jgi:hypothetical protein